MILNEVPILLRYGVWSKLEKARKSKLEAPAYYSTLRLLFMLSFGAIALYIFVCDTPFVHRKLLSPIGHVEESNAEAVEGIKISSVPMSQICA